MHENKRFDLTAIGEILVDFTYYGISEYGTQLLSQNPGGAVANVAAAAARLGMCAAFVGKVGKDIHGEFLTSALENAGVDISGLLSDPDHYTTLAFVQLGKNAERRFSFARNFGADTRMRPEELPNDILTKTKVLHFGSIAMTHEPERSAQLKAIELARASGALLAFDPNYRANLWKSQHEFLRNAHELLEYSDLVKLSDEEIELVTGENEPIRAIEHLLNRGVRAAAVTLGSHGAVAGSIKAGIVSCDGVRCTPVDTTGAGDAFWGGFLTAILNTGKAPEDLESSELRRCTDFANSVGAYCTAHLGGISGMPTIEELNDFLK